MRFWVGVTDKNWFEYLRARRPDEVNFWQPSPRPLAVFLEPGVPFLFKLHSPDDYVVGGGFFVRFSALPARLAWEAFLDNNGVTDYASLKRRIEQYRNEPLRGDPEIGCNILNAPFFFDETDWIPVPTDWARNIVRGRTYDTADSAGSNLWNQVEGRLQALPHLVLQAQAAARYGAEYLTRARLGQGAFRILVTEAYHRKCAITGERTLPVLEAAHIRPYAEKGPHLVSNGLLLRSDIHTLYDEGYLTVTDDLHVEVSRRIKEEFENGRQYYAYDGKPLVELPSQTDQRPSAEFLRWHNEHVFLE
jgi:HNH endonuclease